MILDVQFEEKKSTFDANFGEVIVTGEGGSGKDGKDGKSAYEIWLEQGNEGTEQDFLDSLKGEGIDNSWMDVPILSITIEEDCSYLYIDSINGEPFEFEEVAGNFVLQGITSNSDGRLCFAPKKITGSYLGFLITSTSSTANKPTKGVFHIRHDMLRGWYTEHNSSTGDSWLMGNTSVNRHITHNQPDSAGYRPFWNITSITKFTIIPYSGNLHPGTVINIYGKPVKKEVEV